MGSDMRVLRASCLDLPPEYGAKSPFFTTAMHHGGHLDYTNSDTNQVIYKNGKLSFFDYCNMQLMNKTELQSMIEELGYDPDAQDFFMIPCPGCWKQIRSDADIDMWIGTMYEDRICSVYMVPASVSDRPPENGNHHSDAGSNNGSETDDESDESVSIGALSDGDFEHDDLYFLKNVDQDVEWVGLNNGDNLVNDDLDENEANYQSDPEIDNSDLDKSDSSNENGGRKRHRKMWAQYKDSGNKDVTKFELGMMFPNSESLVEAIKVNSLRESREIKFIKSEKTRVRAVCTKSLKLIEKTENRNDGSLQDNYGPLGDKKRVGCDWVVFGSINSDENSIQIKTLNDHHTRARTFTNKTITGKWLGEYYLEKIRTEPNWKLKSFKDHVMPDLKLNVSKHKLYRAKQWAKTKLRGSLEEQYLKLYQYAAELKRTNVGSTIDIIRDELDKKRFLRMYVCLASLKEGMKKHCRPLIGLDGCHLFGAAEGVLLSAVGLDPNNAMYPISYAVVESENKASWKWFLELVKYDLCIENTYGWTFMTDKQKGLMPAIEVLFPNSEHRCCVRHLYNNFKVHYKGMELMNIMNDAYRSTTVPEFKKYMTKLAGKNQEAANWLSEKIPTQWSKAFFDTFVKSDMVLNNLCESFNPMILDARGLPIISMFERIKNILMTRVQVNRGKMASHKGLVCPRIEKIIEKTKHEASFCVATWAGNSKFQVDGPGGQFVCDLEQQTCACRKWDLTGIPCRHGVAAMVYSGFVVEQFVHECYKTKNCIELYSNYIEPTNGSHLWPESSEAPLEPPVYVVNPGQSQHKRRLEEGEKRKKLSAAGTSSNLQPPAPVTKKLSRSYKSMVKCTTCGAQGHNKRTCGKVKTKKQKKRTIAKGKGSEPSEVPLAPTPASNIDQASMAPNSFMSQYSRAFGNVFTNNSAGTSGSAATVMQRHASLSQQQTVAPTTMRSRGEKVVFSSQPS